MKTRLLFSIILLLGLSFAPAAQAVLVSYSLGNVAGNTWQFDYSITASTALAPNTGFSVFFDVGEAENLVALSGPANWSMLVVQPGSFIGDPTSRGFYDALSLNGLGAGVTAGLFSVQFDWLLGGTPTVPQDFEIYSLANEFEILEIGQTSPVPLPAGIWLFASALAGLGFARRCGLVDRPKS